MALNDRLTSPSSPLDGPPPSPDQGAPGQPSFASMASPFPIAQRGLVGPEAMPPELLAGIQSRAQQLLNDLDAFSQVTPMHGPLLGQARDLITQYLKQLTLAGAPPSSPTSTGTPFPGGGFERGGAPV